MDEVMISGYCRCTDQSRIVTAELENGQWFCDCNFGNCPYEGSCAVAEKLRQLDN